MPSTARRPAATLALALTATLLLAACSATGPDPQAPPSAVPVAPAAPDAGSTAVDPVEVVVTTSILGDLVGSVVGADATVRVLIGPGVDPHGYAASAADAAAMRDADLVVANGLGLEEGLLDVLDAARADGVRVLEVAPELDPIAAGEHDHGHDHGHDHDHDHDHGDGDGDGEALDPHFWFDPIRAARAVELVAAELAEVRPDVDWAVRAGALRVELEALDRELTAIYAAIPADRRRIVTNHDALGYLADRYGLEIVATVLPGTSTTVATDAAAFAALADLLVRERIDVVIAETTESDALALRLAEEVRDRGGPEVTVLTLHTGALGPPGSGAETYTGLLRTSADLIAGALAR